MPMNVLAFETESTIVETKELQVTGERIQKKEAKDLLFQAPEATALTVEGEQELKEHYVEKYMPIEGCSLTEELPKTSDINYVPPKPKPKPKPVVKSKPPVKPTPKPTVVVKAVKKKVEVKVAAPKEPVVVKEKVEKAKTVEPIHASAISMSADERFWLEKLVEAESAGESFEGKVAVASVIANRVELKEFPNSVMGVIKAPKQFSPFMDGSIHRRTPSAETLKAVALVFDQGQRNVSKDTAFFCTTAIAPYSWIGKNKPLVKTIGNHNFYLK